MTECVEVFLSNKSRVILYFALLWAVFVSVKAFYEAYKTSVSDIVGEKLQEHQDAHKRQHIAVLLGIAFTSLFMIFSYVWFDVENTGLRDEDRSIGIFLVLFINLLWLVIINHFKNERLGKSHILKISEIFKF